MGLHFALFLTCFALVISNTNYIFAEISKNGLGSIPLKVPKQPVDHCNDNFCHFIFSLPFPELSRKSSCILYGGLREHTLCMTPPPPQGPQQGLPNAPPAGPGRAQDIAFRWWDPVMTYATFHAPETSFGPHFNTFLAWVETRGHRASYKMYDVHDVPSLPKKIIFFNFYFFEIPKRLPLCAHPGESKNALRVVGGAWGAELRTITSRVILHPVQLYSSRSAWYGSGIIVLMILYRTV